MKYFYFILISLALIASCKEEKQPEFDGDPHAGMNMQGMDGSQIIDVPESNVMLDGSTMSFENVEMTIPDGWINEEPSSSMRVVQFFAKDDDQLVIAGFYFGNRDEMIEANIKRWEAEFIKMDNSTKKEYANGKATLVEISGTYRLKPFPMAEEFKEAPNYITLAAIVATENGPYFFKMVGPKIGVDKERDNFDKFIKSYKQK